MADSVADTAPKLSDKLMQARESKGMSLESVADQLNLSVSQLKMLESHELDLTKLSPFERGYIRNYARFLELDISEYESQFPSGLTVGADLQSVQRYSYKTTKPLMSRGWVKMIIFIALIILAVWMISESGVDFSQIDYSSIENQASDIQLPTINKE